jgi:hypothetical protein
VKGKSAFALSRDLHISYRLLAAAIFQQCIDLDDIGARSASCRTQAGPERTQARSSTVKRDKASEARGEIIQEAQAARRNRKRLQRYPRDRWCSTRLVP